MSNSVCPWWAGYFLLNPIRSILQNPDKILRNYVEKDMHVLDIGCGMGFFSIPMAKLLGENGHVLAVDLQDKMIKSLNHRALKAGLSNKIKTKICSSQSLEIDDFIEKIDFALAFAVVHEVPDKKNLFRELSCSISMISSEIILISGKMISII